MHRITCRSTVSCSEQRINVIEPRQYIAKRIKFQIKTEKLKILKSSPHNTHEQSKSCVLTVKLYPDNVQMGQKRTFGKSDQIPEGGNM
jgi:hypothetical protein